MMRRIHAVEGLVAAYNDGFFAQLGVSKDQARARAQAIHQQIPHHPLDQDAFHAVQSIHFEVFAALERSGFRPANILEIGTYLGYTTMFLCKLWPDAKVVTVDLPDEDPIYKDFHSITGSNHGKLMTERLADLPQVEIQRINSALLFTLDLPNFDLIWLDGGHNYPEVAFDHIYSLSKLASGGWVLSDDIRFPAADHPVKDPRKFEAFQVTDYFNQRPGPKFGYLLKREDAATYVTNPEFLAYHHKAPG